MSDARRIVITRPLPGDPVGLFRDAGFSNIWVNPVDERLPRKKLLDAVAGAHGVLATPADVLIDREFFDAAGEQLVIVANFAVGVDNVDLAEARRRNIIIGHTPHAVTEPTADAAWLLMLGAAKRAHEGEALVRSGQWQGVGPNELLGLRVVGKTLLIVGAGRIALATARRSIGWNMRVLYVSRSRHGEFELAPINARQVELDEGLRDADFISVHLPLKDDTKRYFGRREFNLMKRTAVFVNTARGGVVDEAALVEALRDGTIAAAGLDVYEREPALADGLAELPNAFLLPHLGSATREDRLWMMQMSVENIIAALRGQTVPHRYE